MTAKDAVSQAFDEMFVMDELPNPPKKEKSLAEHAAECEAKTPESCPFVKKMAKELEEREGLSPEEAMQKSIGLHTAAIQDSKAKGNNGGGQKDQPNQNGGNEIKPDAGIQMLDDPLPATETISTPIGDIPVTTQTQKRVVEMMAKSAAEGNENAKKCLSQLREAVLNNGGGENQQSDGQGPADTIASSDGSTSFQLDEKAIEILKNTPEKKVILQAMVDLCAKANAGGLSEEEFKDLEADYRTLRSMFYGEDSEEKNDSNESARQDGQRQDGNAQNQSGQQTNQREDEESDEEEPAPSDEEFRIGDNKYQVGDTVYTDTSGMGVLRGMLTAFMAGLHGEMIITGLDRLNGTWDRVKRSAAGEKVRDGILAAQIKATISDYENTPGLSREAALKLAALNEMAKQATTPKEYMAIVDKLEKWKKAYVKEQDAAAEEKEGAFKPFQPLKPNYKGRTPPLSILNKPLTFESDKEFGDAVSAAVRERLGGLGFPLGDLEGVKVGPSATTIEFKVPPTFDMVSAQGKKVRAALKGALGTDITQIEYASGKKDVLSIQITNLKMRDVSFSGCLHGAAWQEFIKKAFLPVTLGKDAAGNDVNLDLARQPHTVVTGESGSGKSVFLLAALNSLEMAKTPEQARVVLLDPKDEFKSQDGSPHLLYPRASKAKDIANVVSSLKALMQERISKIGGTVQDFDPTKNEFHGNSDRNIVEYNKAHPEDKMPHVLMMFDEVAAIMKDPEVGDQVKQDLSQILALGRSVGINCILATQRDDVASIPGELKANAPAKIAFKAAPDDAVASKAAKSLAGSGDFIMTDKEGKQTRGRGCFISDEEIAAVPAYYRSHMGDAAEVSYPLPPGHMDAIHAAVRDGRQVTMPVQKGYADSFREAFPADWSIEEVEVNGRKSWKASPPPPPVIDGQQSSGNGSQAPGNAAQPSDGTGQEKSQQEEKTDWRTAANRDDAVSAIEKIRDKAKADAWDKFNASQATPEDKSALKNALANADSDFHEDLELVNMKFPPPLEGDADEGDGGDASGNGTGEQAGAGSENSDLGDDTPAATMNDVETYIAAESERIDKQLSKPSLKPRDRQKLRKEKKTLKERLSAARTKFETGGTPDEILDALDSPTGGDAEGGNGGHESAEAQNGNENGEQGEVSTEQTKEEKDAALKATVKPQRFYNAGGFGATEKLSPKEIKTVSEKFMPDGWEFVTDNTFGAPAKTKNGVVFVRHPTNGSYGRIIIKKDEKGKDTAKLQVDVDTTHPEYRGFVKNADGTYGLSEEGKKLEQEYKRVRKYSDDEKERSDIEKKWNRFRFGHDEAPDNMAIIGSAVAVALDRLRLPALD